MKTNASISSLPSLPKQTDLQEDIIQVEYAVDLFLNSEFQKALELLTTKYNKSLYFTMGYSTLSQLKALMTFDCEDIQIAMDSLLSASELAEKYKKPATFMSYLMGKESMYEEMTAMQRHAELVSCEAQLLRATLSIITMNSVLILIKEALSIRNCYNTTKSLFHFVEKVYLEEGFEGYIKYGIDEHFISGILVQYGLFNLLFSHIFTYFYYVVTQKITSIKICRIYW